MVTIKIGRHTVEMYDSIEELPIVRFHKYQKMLLIDAGIGADIAAFDQRLEKARRFLMKGNIDRAQMELENLRQCVYLIQNNISPKNRAFAILVAKIDGKETEISDNGIDKVIETLNDAPVTELAAQFEAVKKKIDTELMLYFPALFNNSDIKEYYDILRRRAMAVLKNIVAGESIDTDEIERLTTELMTYSKPRVFAGSESAEIKHDRQFEDLCLALSEQLNIRPKECTVLEFYNAFDFLRDRARKAQNTAKNDR